MQHAFLIDLTKREDDVSQVITDVREYSAKFSPIVTQWVARRDQKPLLGTDVVHEDYHNPELPARIRTLVQHMSQNGASGSTIHVLSYEGTVLAAVSTLNGPECCVVGQPIRGLETVGVRIPFRAPARAAVVPYVPRSYPTGTTDSEGLSIEAAITLAKRVLLEGGHTSSARPLHQTRLRPEMVLRDRRAAKNQSDLISRNLIPTVVNAGVREGWLHRDIFEGRSGYEFIWIDEHKTGETALPHPVAYTSTPVFQPHLLPTPPPAPAEAQAPVNAPPTPDAEVPSDVSVVPSSPKETKYRETVSGQMELIFREEEIGTPANVRPTMFTALREALGETSEGIETSHLWRIIAEKAERIADGKTRVQDWDRVTECFLNMLFGAGVLLDGEGRPIQLGFAKWSSKVASFEQEDLELRAEAYLAFRVIVRRGEISSKDEVLSLGFAIYQQGKVAGPKTREIKVRTTALIYHLLLLKRISVSEDGKITPMTTTN